MYRRITSSFFSQVPSTKVREIAAMLKAIHAGEDIGAAHEKAVRVLEKLHGLRLTTAARLRQWRSRRRWPNTPSPRSIGGVSAPTARARILREIRPRTRVVGSFADGQSALNLAAARLRHIAGTAWSTKRYLNLELLKDHQMRGAVTA